MMIKNLALKSVLALGIASLFSACAITVNADGGPTGQRVMRSTGTAKFQCVQSASGQCFYALYTSRCHSLEGTGGKAATSCTHQVIEEFSVPVGQTRELHQLPNGYQQCMRADAKPEIPHCS